MTRDARIGPPENAPKFLKSIEAYTALPKVNIRNVVIMQTFATHTAYSRTSFVYNVKLASTDCCALITSFSVYIDASKCIHWRVQVMIYLSLSHLGNYEGDWCCGPYCLSWCYTCARDFWSLNYLISQTHLVYWTASESANPWCQSMKATHGVSRQHFHILRYRTGISVDTVWYCTSLHCGENCYHLSHTRQRQSIICWEKGMRCPILPWPTNPQLSQQAKSALQVCSRHDNGFL